MSSTDTTETTSIYVPSSPPCPPPPPQQILRGDKQDCHLYLVGPCINVLAVQFSTPHCTVFLTVFQVLWHSLPLVQHPSHSLSQVLSCDISLVPPTWHLHSIFPKPVPHMVSFAARWYNSVSGMVYVGPQHRACPAYVQHFSGALVCLPEDAQTQAEHLMGPFITSTLALCHFCYGQDL